MKTMATSSINTGSVEDTGTVEIGGGNGTSTIDGRIADGMGAACSSGSCANKVYKIGTGTITFSDTSNSYSGGDPDRSGHAADLGGRQPGHGAGLGNGRQHQHLVDRHAAEQRQP